VNKPKFFADEMLGRLAKWLRLLGYDTKYSSGIPDSDLIDIAVREGRVILTRDTRLIVRRKCQDYIFIRDDRWREQLRQVCSEAELNSDAILTICPVCNAPLKAIEKALAKKRVPAYVYDTQERFAACDQCSRIFWEGTHAEGIAGELARLLQET
jgi:hypothetical protein